MPKLVATAEMIEDRAAVAVLPNQWTARRGHAGPVLANYLKQREQDHQAALQDLNKKTSMLNAEINAKIRTYAENLLIIIKQNQADINCIVDSKDKSLTAVSRFKALNNVKDLHAQRVGEIANFKYNGLECEKERAHRLREIWSHNFARLVAIGHIPPKDLSHDFDMHNYAANQQLLSNSRALVDLEARLRAQADASMVRARSSLNQFCLRVKSTVRQNNNIRSLSALSTLSTPKGESVALEPIKNVEQFTKCVQLIKTVYKNVLYKMFSSYSVRFINLRDSVGECSGEETPVDDFKLSELSLLTEKLRRFTIYTEHRQTCIHNDVLATYNDALKLPKMLEQLRELLQTMFDIFNDGSHLLDAHMWRLAIAQKITMAGVEDLATHNDFVELAIEIPFGITLDKLCNSADIDILQTHYEQAKMRIDYLTKLYFSHSEAEIEGFGQFMDLCMKESDILLAEFDCFLQRHSSTPIQSTVSNSAVENTLDTLRDSAVSPTRPLARVIFESEIQGQALQKWKNGFLESFKSHISAVPDELKRQAKSWVKMKTDIMKARYNLKMVSHSIRMERLKAAWEKRQAELKCNEDRLQSHLNAIFNLIDSLKTQASECLSINAPSLYPLCNRVAQIEKSLNDLIAPELYDSEMIKMKMASYHTRLLKHQNLFEMSLQKAIDEYNVSLKDRLHAARVSNFRYISTLKLSHEGGSYSNQEMASTVRALVRVANDLEMCVNSVRECIAKRHAQLVYMADRLLAPLLDMIGKQMKKSVYRLSLLNQH